MSMSNREELQEIFSVVGGRFTVKIPEDIDDNDLAPALEIIRAADDEWPNKLDAFVEHTRGNFEELVELVKYKWNNCDFIEGDYYNLGANIIDNYGWDEIYDDIGDYFDFEAFGRDAVDDYNYEEVETGFLLFD